jgi:hypothetical protein
MLTSILIGAAVALVLAGVVAALMASYHVLGFWQTELFGIGGGIVRLALEVIAAILQAR